MDRESPRKIGKNECLDRLRSELIELSAEREQSDGSLTDAVEPIVAGHPVHAAVVALQFHYSGNKLPIRPWRWWRQLLRVSRAEEIDEVAGEAYYEAVDELLEFVAVERAADPPPDRTTKLIKPKPATIKIIELLAKGAEVDAITVATHTSAANVHMISNRWRHGKYQLEAKLRYRPVLKT